MFKIFGANVVVSKNFDNEDPIRVSEKSDIISFRLGEQKYDTRAKDNKRWINVTAKAKGDLAERIKKMKLKVGSTLIVSGELDIEQWETEKSEKRMDVVIWLSDIEYQYTGSGKSENSDGQAKDKSQSDKKTSETPKKKTEYEAYDDDGDDPF